MSQFMKDMGSLYDTAATGFGDLYDATKRGALKVGEYFGSEDAKKELASDKSGPVGGYATHAEWRKAQEAENKRIREKYSTGEDGKKLSKSERRALMSKNKNWSKTAEGIEYNLMKDEERAAAEGDDGSAEEWAGILSDALRQLTAPQKRGPTPPAFSGSVNTTGFNQALQLKKENPFGPVDLTSGNIAGAAGLIQGFR